MELRPETKALIAKANGLLAIWQEQEKTNDRAWDEQSAAHDEFHAIAQEGEATAEEIFTAYKRWRALYEHAKSLPSYLSAQQEWQSTRSRAQFLIAEDAGLFRSEEELRWEKELGEREKEENRNA